MKPRADMNTYKVAIPYTESANPRKKFRIEYTIEAPDREIALRKAEKEFFAYTLYNSASWVRTIDREAVRVWRLLPDHPQTSQTIDELAEQLKSPDPDILYNTLNKLGDLEDAGPSSLVIALLPHENQDIAALAAETLGKFGDPNNLISLARAYRPEADPKLKACILSAIGRLQQTDDVTIDIVAQALGDEDPRLRANAVEAADKLHLPLSTRMLVPLLEDEDNRVRANVLKALWHTHDRRALMKVLQEMTESSNRWMRASAAFVLRHLDMDDRLPLLKELYKDPVAEVQTNARKALLQFEDLSCFPLWMEAVTEFGDLTFAQLAERTAAFGTGGFDAALTYLPKTQQQKALARDLLDYLEQHTFQTQGWWAWLTLKKKRLFRKA